MNIGDKIVITWTNSPYSIIKIGNIGIVSYQNVSSFNVKFDNGYYEYFHRNNNINHGMKYMTLNGIRTKKLERILK